MIFRKPLKWFFLETQFIHIPPPSRNDCPSNRLYLFADTLHKGNFPVSPCTLRRRKFAKATSLSVKDENETSVVLTWQLPAN
jgi:hypothetical protein